MPMKLPNDPVILMSYLNTLLRDKYSSLEELCADNELSVGEITSVLAGAGFKYSAETNSFR